MIGTEGQVRLVDGNGYSSGRVEIYHNGVWGTVCDDSFGISNAIVICRQLGFSSAADYFCCAHYGRGNGTIWLDNVSCNGSESSISSCNHNSWGSHDCGHNEDVGVACINAFWSPNSTAFEFLFITQFNIARIAFLSVKDCITQIKSSRSRTYSNSKRLLLGHYTRKMER
ncbi:uncharacterized protein TRIADDRAFT_53246 [Trichoplax adhaerens]|uniref:SRCR domain-containing protein n=1 Tax=Trichoplax adhaerens TaxID=10228 RepID=B3RNQ1_TRIAD|nr:hypothetical protein TRIADDRAFT_53246 [Trichoplax adhaerens]EDV27500.1 hypothetical protein TRIADDRAFT_53246 [Trichoplax adhaerens]|eukprot:XP_002109334.1 hypothetical protein TRIADDRAFT_53246 [Trichoplax adhaerens]